MFNAVIRPLLEKLPFERARRIVLLLLRLAGLVPGGRWLLERCFATEDPSLAREVFGVRFRNPIGVAAGFDRDGEVFAELGALGFGFVEIGTLTPRPQSGNPLPRVFRLPQDEAFIHRTGFPNRGLETAIRHLRRGHRGVVVGCNIACNAATPVEAAPKDFLKLFRNLYQYVDYFSVNVSGDDIRDEAAVRTNEYLTAILEPLFDFRRGQNRYRPILLKISPDLTDEEIDRVADILIATPLDGIVATSGTRRREGLATAADEVERIGAGRLCGRPLTERSIAVVRRLRERSGDTYPIIGSGGMMTAADVRAMLDAGADLVQLHTGLLYRGPQLLKEVCRSLAAPETTETAETVDAPETLAAPEASAASEAPEAPGQTDQADQAEPRERTAQPEPAAPTEHPVSLEHPAPSAAPLPASDPASES